MHDALQENGHTSLRTSFIRYAQVMHRKLTFFF